MENPLSNENLKIDFSDHENILLTKQQTLRRLVGTLGMFLPFVLILVLFYTDRTFTPLDSISHYFYTKTGGVFQITLGLLAFFLLIYKGYEPFDFWISTAAGLFALCVVFFPTDNIPIGTKIDCNHCAVTNYPTSALRVAFHYLSAAIFLGCLAIMSFFVFTKSDKPPSKRSIEKNQRNLLFKITGIIMVIAMIIIALGGLKIIKEPFYSNNNLTFWMEVIALEAFAVAWFVKGELILKDK